MLLLKTHKSSLQKSTVAAVANISDTKPSIFYGQDGVSLYVCEVPAGMLIAVLHLWPTGFETFECDKPGHIDIDLTVFSKLLNLATDQEVITISFGDIRNVKTFHGDKTIKFRFKDLVFTEENSISGTDNTRFYKMEISKANREPVDRFEGQYDDLAIGIPSQELKRVFSELAIPGETGDYSGDDDKLYISLSNGQLRFSTKDRDIILKQEVRMVVQL